MAMQGALSPWVRLIEAAHTSGWHDDAPLPRNRPRKPALRSGHPPAQRHLTAAAVSCRWHGQEGDGRRPEGRLPRGIGVERLRDAPAEWSRQFEALGLNPR